MGIVSSQVFEFETDDLNVMESVLDAMLPIWFSRGKQGFQCVSKLNPGSFNDGKPDRRVYVVVETAQGCEVVKPRRIFSGVQVYGAETPERWRPHDAACTEASQLNKKRTSKPAYMWLTSLEGPYRDPYGGEVLFNDSETAKQHLLNAFETGDKDKFRKEYEGEPRWFDGSSTVGYRIDQRWNTVFASYCTILYGK